MKGTELRTFSHLQILTKLSYPDLSRNLQFVFIHIKAVKVSENDQIQM